jgi:hypothetical protein
LEFSIRFATANLANVSADPTTREDSVISVEMDSLTIPIAPVSANNFIQIDDVPENLLLQSEEIFP